MKLGTVFPYAVSVRGCMLDEALRNIQASVDHGLFFKCLT